MMKKSFISIMSAALVLASCAQDVLEQEANTITCSVENVSTRTLLAAGNGVYNVNWEKGDVIVVKSDSGTATYSTSQGGKPTATFNKKSGEVPSGALFTAYYPQEIAGGSLPSEQDFKNGNISHSPMIATSTTTDFQFKNICGILKLNISTNETGLKVSSINLLSDNGLSGDYIIVNDAAVVTGGKGIKLNCGAGISISSTPKPFHFAVPAGEYTSFTILVTIAGKGTVSASLKSGSVFKVDRSGICELNMELGPVETQAKGYGKALLLSGTEFNERVKQLASISGSPDVQDKNTNVKKIEFKTSCFDKASSLIVSDPSSDYPVYASFKSGVLTIFTPAEELYTNESPAYMFYYMSSVEEIVNLKALNTENGVYFNNMFHMSDSLSNLKSLDLSNFDTSKGFNFKSMFNSCSSLTELDLSSFRTPNASYFSYMFDGCTSLKKLDLSTFSSDKVITMEYMFRDCWALEFLNLSSFDTGNVNDMKYMFCRCQSLKELDIDSFATPNLGDASYMFNKTLKLEVLKMKNFDFTKLKTSSSMSYMFYQMPCLKELHLGEKGHTASASLYPSNFFLSSGNAAGVRTSSTAGKLDIYCTKTDAGWLARNDLRWINSGYSGKKAIPVTFYDYLTKEVIPVTWRAN